MSSIESLFKDMKQYLDSRVDNESDKVQEIVNIIRTRRADNKRLPAGFWSEDKEFTAYICICDFVNAYVNDHSDKAHDIVDIITSRNLVQYGLREVMDIFGSLYKVICIYTGKMYDMDDIPSYHSRKKTLYKKYYKYIKSIFDKYGEVDKYIIYREPLSDSIYKDIIRYTCFADVYNDCVYYSDLVTEFSRMIVGEQLFETAVTVTEGVDDKLILITEDVIHNRNMLIYMNDLLCTGFKVCIIPNKQDIFNKFIFNKFLLNKIRESNSVYEDIDFYYGDPLEKDNYNAEQVYIINHSNKYKLKTMYQISTNQ